MPEQYIPIVDLLSRLSEWPREEHGEVRRLDPSLLLELPMSTIFPHVDGTLLKFLRRYSDPGTGMMNRGRGYSVNPNDEIVEQTFKILSPPLQIIFPRACVPQSRGRGMSILFDQINTIYIPTIPIRAHLEQFHRIVSTRQMTLREEDSEAFSDISNKINEYFPSDIGISEMLRNLRSLNTNLGTQISKFHGTATHNNPRYRLLNRFIDVLGSIDSKFIHRIKYTPLIDEDCNKQIDIAWDLSGYDSQSPTILFNQEGRVIRDLNGMPVIVRKRVNL